MNMRLAPHKARLRDLMAESESLNPTVAEGEVQATLSPADNARVLNLSDAFTNLIQSEINPCWLRWGLDSISGLEIDDQPATVESLINDGPKPLCEEILTEIRKLAELSPSEISN